MTERTWSQSSVDNIVVVSGDGKNVGNNGEHTPNDSKSSSFSVPKMQVRNIFSNWKILISNIFHFSGLLNI